MPTITHKTLQSPKKTRTLLSISNKNYKNGRKTNASQVCYLSAPQLDSPVERGRNKQVGKVQGPQCCVTVEARDGSMVALKHLTDACFAVKHRLAKGL